MKKLFALVTALSLFVGTSYAQGLSAADSAALFNNSSAAKVVALDSQELADTEGKFVGVLLLVLLGVLGVGGVATGVTVGTLAALGKIH